MSEIQVTSINGMGAITDLGGGSFSTTGMEANDHMHVSEDFIQGAGVVKSSDYTVAQASVPGKKVTVSGGVAYVLNSDYSDLSLAEQKYWRCKMAGDTDVTITDNISGNPRIDIICIKVDPTATPNGEATNVATLVAVAGTPAASPTVPATPDDYLKLADVAVANGFTSILNANITDRSALVSICDNNGGWTSVTGTWAYASATTITVPSGAVSRYQKGDKIKLTQTTDKYFYIIGVADTVLTITGGDVYTLTNATIINPQFSRLVSPIGFPTKLGAGTATWTTTGTAFTNQPTGTLYFTIMGSKCSYFTTFLTNATSGGTGVFIATFTAGYLPPVSDAAGLALNITTFVSGSSFTQGSVNNVIKIFKYDGTAIAGNNNYFVVNGSYDY